MAYYDVMTGLYNRNYFVRLLADFVRRAEEENTVVSVMFIDVDDFSKINDGFGLAVGDEVVQQFGQFLQEFSSSMCWYPILMQTCIASAFSNPWGNTVLRTSIRQCVNGRSCHSG